jgi:uncharacterized protein
MRLSRELIQQIAEAVAASIETKGLITLKTSHKDVVSKVAEVITADLQAEDRLNKEVEKVLAAYEGEISKGGMDYRKVFDLTKQKLAKERGIVL